ncbi:peptide deformylase [Corynebacterium renale]|uniref:peptide deformylase n=1 Tax=Corynebacterium renale TaxID=1724 RepID=UPI000DA366F9|nr:peptide deformylase [Corynebacterium renale]SQG64752.1 peptide deformylase [Corynebacterium renale]
MAVRELKMFGAVELTTAASPVKMWDSRLHTLVEDMFDTMYARGGVGLAGNQIGVLQRLFVYDTRRRGNGLRGVLINPTWEPLSEEVQHGAEGCLSIPGISLNTPRYQLIQASGFDQYGRRQAIVASGLLARCIQHESDHLDGTLFLDRVSRDQKREAIATFRSTHPELF